LGAGCHQPVPVPEIAPQGWGNNFSERLPREWHAKPQRDSQELESLVVSLEATTGEERWSLAIADPSLQRLEYEDPDQPGRLLSKSVKVDDVEFIVRAPLTAGVRQVAVFRKEKTGQQANQRRLLARMPLPAQAIK
jgi:hypothetical protein